MRPAGRLLAAALLLRAAPLVAQGLASPGPLTAAHEGYDNLASCLACHESGRELTGRRCLACHVSLAARIREGRGYHARLTHNGLELRCAECHSEHNGRPYRLVRWPGNVPAERFDHALAGWRLEGAHARLRCAQCHREGLLAAAVRADTSVARARTFLGLGTGCGACHLDEHRGRVSRTCADCHTQESWTPAPGFDHARTDFPLTGLHGAVACARCHQVRRDRASGPGGARDTSFTEFRAGEAATGCASCHRAPHRDAARMRRCESCHTTDGWFRLADSLRTFDHASIGFPLRGAHAQARCERCHLSSTAAPLAPHVALIRANFLLPFARRDMAFARCDDCHADVHAGELAPRGRDCAVCHDETAFAPTRFTAALHDSAWTLTGAHTAVPCTACHGPLPGATRASGRIRFRHPDASCAGCHRDVHLGQFGERRCETCHITESWERVAGFDHAATRYPLRGAHLRVPCGRCHPAAAPGEPIRFRGLPLSCGTAGCHEDLHGGQFAGRARGDACTTCHDEDAWRPVRFDHQTDSDWPLDGAHRPAPCTACHRPAGTPPVVRWRPLAHRCEDCHAGGRT